VSESVNSLVFFHNFQKMYQLWIVRLSAFTTITFARNVKFWIINYTTSENIKGQEIGCDRPTKAGWQPGRLQPEPLPADTPGTPFPALPTTASLFEGMSRIDNSLMGNIAVNAGKRQIGKGFIGFLTDAEYRQSRIDANVHQQMVALHDHRYVL